MGIGAQLDPRSGGAFRVELEDGHIASGHYTEVDPPHRLVMTWGWEGDAEVAPGSTTVEITLTPDGPGTVLRLRHGGLPNEQQRASHRDGWRELTGALKALFD